VNNDSREFLLLLFVWALGCRKWTQIIIAIEGEAHITELIVESQG